MGKSTEGRIPIGAEVLPGGGVRFRVWAPDRQRVEVVIEGGAGRRGPGETLAVELEAEGGGYFSGRVGGAGDGTLYRYRLDGGEAYPDPASRFQPEGPHGPSRVVDPGAFRWTDGGWPGLTLKGQVLYELHVGTFTPEGTWESAARELEELKGLGITTVEVMPVADFPGLFGWGYDGVDLYAPTRLYGEPDDFRRFVDRAHALGLGVILDVVYNHIGPDGAYHRQFAGAYYSERHKTEWGDSLNFDGPGSGPVREFFVENAGYWIDEYHLDGLRLDATQAIVDDSADHVLAELGRKARAKAGGRSILIFAENDFQEARLARPPERGGYGLDGLWNNDFHHSAIVAMTGRSEAYYSDFMGSAQELVSALKWGYLFQGQYSRFLKRRVGMSTFGMKAAQFVTYLENHDQVSNSARGDRLQHLTSPGRYKAMTAAMLLGPGTPMLFHGQEFAASSPFLYFADHTPELSRLVREGRVETLSMFGSMANPDMKPLLPDPGKVATYLASKLDLSERESHAEAYAMTRDLLRLRREDPTISKQECERVFGAVIGPEAFVLRFVGDGGDDRLLVVNLGRDLHSTPLGEPMLAPPDGKTWQIVWYSENPRYGGCGAPPVDTDELWNIPGHSALLLGPAAP